MRQTGHNPRLFGCSVVHCQSLRSAHDLPSTTDVIRTRIVGAGFIRPDNNAGAAPVLNTVMNNVSTPPASSHTPAAPSDDSGPSPENILKLGTAFWASKALLSAVELQVFTFLATQPGTLESIQRGLGLHSRSARDFLDTLVALGMLKRENGVYSNTADTELFLDRNKPSYIGGILEMANARLYPFWSGLTDRLKTGLPQNEVKNHRRRQFLSRAVLRPSTLAPIPHGDDRR